MGDKTVEEIIEEYRSSIESLRERFWESLPEHRLWRCRSIFKAKAELNAKKLREAYPDFNFEVVRDDKYTFKEEVGRPFLVVMSR